MNFMLKSRICLIRNLSDFKLKIDEEKLFLSMIVHSVDHFSAFEVSDGIRMSFHDPNFPAKNRSNLDVFWALMFRYLFVRETLNPFCSNLIKEIKEPFYQKLYQDLAEIDKEFADHITASIMY